MFMEFQITAELFATIVRNRLRSLPICLDQELSLLGADYVVDRLDFGEGTTVRRERRLDRSSGVPVEADAATNHVWIISPTGSLHDFDAPYLQVCQPITVYLVSAADLRVHAEQPSPTVPIALMAVFNVDLSAPNFTQGGGRPQLQYRIAYLDYGSYDTLIPMATKTVVEQWLTGFTPAPVDMDVTALNGVVGAGGAVNAVNCGIVCDRAATRVAMRMDFEIDGQRSGSVTDTFFQQDPADLLHGKQWAIGLDPAPIVEQVRDRIRVALNDSPKVKTVSGPTASWQPATCAVGVHAGLELLGACPFFVDDIDMDVDVDITASLSVADNTLTTHVNIDGAPSNIGETILCAVTGGLLWPFMGPLLLKDEDLGTGIGYYFAGVAVAPVGPVVAMLFAIYGQDPPDVSKELGASTRKIDDNNYETVQPLSVFMPLSPPGQQRMNFETVYGTMDLVVFAGSIGGLSSVKAGTTAVEPSELGWFLDGSCRSGGYRIAAIATITTHGSMDSPLCSGRIIGDPQGEYTLTKEGNNLVVREQFRPEFAALADPYPCQVRVITKRGVRTIVYPPVPPITIQEQQHLEELRRNFNKMCRIWRDSFHQIEVVGVPKPPPMEHPDWTMWQIALHDLAADDRVTISTMTKQPLTVLTAPATGVVFGTLLLPGDAADQLQLSLAGDDTARRHPAITVRQLHYAARAELPVRGSLHDLRFVSEGHRRILSLRDTVGAVDIDTTVVRRPVIARSRRVAAETAAARQMLTGNGRRLRSTPHDDHRQVLRPITDVAGASSSTGVDFVAQPRIGGIRRALYVRSGDTATIYDTANAAKPVIAQQIFGHAWFETSVLGGDQLARYDANSGCVRLYHCVGVAVDGHMNWFT